MLMKKLLRIHKDFPFYQSVNTPVMVPLTNLMCKFLVPLTARKMLRMLAPILFTYGYAIVDASFYPKIIHRRLCCWTKFRVIPTIKDHSRRSMLTETSALYLNIFCCRCYPVPIRPSYRP